MDLDPYQLLTEQVAGIFHPNQSFYSIVRTQVDDVRRLINRLKINTDSNRRKRSLEFLESAWKWLPGSPDQHDFEILNNSMN